MRIKPTKEQQADKTRHQNRYSEASRNFDREFPGVIDFSLNLDETDYGNPIGEQIHVSKAHLWPIFCKNQFCHGGGFDLLHVLHEMTYRKETHRTIQVHCPGLYYSSDPKNKTCSHHFRGDLTISYTEPEHD